MERKKLLVGISGSFCNHLTVFNELGKLKDYDLSFVLTKNVQTYSTRFMTNHQIREHLQLLTKHPILETLTDAEWIGPHCEYDMMLIAPCTASMLSRLALGYYDCPVALSFKAMLRNQKKIVLAVATNDGIGVSGVHIMQMIQKKNIYMVPMFQDDMIAKPNSLVADFSQIEKTLEYALKNLQIQPILGGNHAL